MTSRGATERTRPAAPPAGDTPPAGEARLAELYAAMGTANIQALWTQAADLMPGEPAPRAVPWLWRWETVLALAAGAGEAVPIGRGGERRALALANPGLGGAPFATGSLWGAMQYLNARESAPAHRHSAAAIRFVRAGQRRPPARAARARTRPSCRRPGPLRCAMRRHASVLRIRAANARRDDR